MSKGTGIGQRLYVGGYNLSGQIGSLSSIGGGPATLDVPDITQGAMARIGGHRDGRIEFDAYWDPAANAHARLSLLPTTDAIMTFCAGTTIADWSASLTEKQVGYDPTRGEDGSLMLKSQALANGYGLEWGQLLTAVERTDTGATNGAGVDFAAATAFGLQAWLQVISFTGTDVTIKIQESSDNAVGDAFADVVGGGFTQVTSGPQAQRIETSRTLAVERYLRVVTTTSGGFSSLVFLVQVAKNVTSVVF